MTPSRTTSFVACAWLMAMLLAAVCDAQTRSVSIAWDANREKNVAGYIVYVGTQPGTYSESFDVGSVTTFTYQGAATQPYYFAVAAYFPGPVVGRRSAEVASIPIGIAIPRPGTAAVAPPVAALSASRSAASCERDCGAVVRFESLRPLTAIASTPDGRLFIVEEGRRISVLPPHGQATTVYETDTARIAAIAPGPDYQQTAYFYAAEIVATPGAARELDIVRYREVDGRLGERAVLVPGLPASDNGVAITFDAAGTLYVAIGEGDARDPRSGRLLRYTAGGAVPDDNPTPYSPVVANGLATAAALSADSRDRIWLAGRDGQGDVVIVPGNAPPSLVTHEPALMLRAREPVVGIAPGPTASTDTGPLMLVGSVRTLGVVRNDTLFEQQYPISGDYSVAGLAAAGAHVFAIVARDGAARYQVVEWVR
jgi:hypothetical protein